MNLNNNYYQNLNDEEDDETLIINEDLFEQKEPDITDEDQIIIQNEYKEDDYSFNSNKSENKKSSKKKEEKITNLRIKNFNNNDQNIIINNISNENNIIIHNSNINNDNLNIIKYQLNNNNTERPVNISSFDIGKEKNKNFKYIKKIVGGNSKINKKNLKQIIPNMPNGSQIITNRIQNKNIDKKDINNNNYKNNYSVIIKKYKYNNLLTNDSESKNGHTKFSNNNIMTNLDNKIVYNNINKNKNISNIKKKGKNATKKNTNYSIKEKNNYNNNNNIKNTIQNNKSKNKRNIIKKNEYNNNVNNSNIKTKKYNHNKSQSQYIYNSVNKKKFKNIYLDYQSKNNSINMDKDKLSWASSEERTPNSFSIQRKKKYEYDGENIKIVLINKMNNQIEEEIKGKQKLYLNQNNNIYFLGFCDLLFELGFIHIKETEIVDISKIEEHIKDLYTQPFTNRDLLSEKFLFNEQILLITAWKTILNNFHLVKEFSILPTENEEITLDDFKLFIFIVTGLFIGYKENIFLNEESKVDKTNIKLDKKNIINSNSINNLKNYNLIPKGKYSNGKIEKNLLGNSNRFNIDKSYKFSHSHNNSPSPKRKKYFFIKNNPIDNYNNENILKKILENKNKSDFNYKNILKIKNNYKYFDEIRKIYNLYKKYLKNLNKKINIEKEYTFYPKTNKNNNKLLNKIPPSMNFLERSALIKNINEQKIKKLEIERSNELLKECTFEPCLSINKKINIDPCEISDRLYYNNLNRKITDPELRKPIHIKNNINIKTNNKKKDENYGNSKIFYKPKIKSFGLKNYNFNNIKIKNRNNSINKNNNFSNNNIIGNTSKPYINTSYKKSYTNNNISKDEELLFSPDINKKFNRAMFSHSPLTNDKLLNKRLNCLRDVHFKKFVDNYEKNNREILSNSIKKNKKILNEIIKEKKGYMKLDIEKKTNKDTFDNFINYNNNNYILLNEPLFFVEIKIKDKIKIIEFYPEDKPEDIVYYFCLQNSLGEASYKKILKIIKDKLEEIKNGIFNENIDDDGENYEIKEKINNNKEVQQKDNEKNNIDNKKNINENNKNLKEDNINIKNDIDKEEINEINKHNDDENIMNEEENNINKNINNNIDCYNDNKNININQENNIINNINSDKNNIDNNDNKNNITNNKNYNINKEVVNVISNNNSNILDNNDNKNNINIENNILNNLNKEIQNNNNNNEVKEIINEEVKKDNF